jgi:hypothetical protein
MTSDPGLRWDHGLVLGLIVGFVGGNLGGAVASRAPTSAPPARVLAVLSSGLLGARFAARSIWHRKHVAIERV